MAESISEKGQPSPYGRGATFLLLLCSLLLCLSVRFERTYWLYIIPSYVFVSLVYFLRLRQRAAAPTSSLFGYLFPPKIWLHASSVNDCLFVLINFSLFVIPDIHPLHVSLLPRQLAHSLIVYTHGFFTNSEVVPGTVMIAFFTLLSVMAGDLFFYLNHRLFHTVPMLWEFHKIHHSAKVLTPLTEFRIHPCEWVCIYFARVIGYALVGCVFMYFYPGIRNVFLVAGLNIGFLLSAVIGGNFRHSHIWIRFGRVIEHVFLSPAQHQIHHSVHLKHINKNFGALFAVWDWAFGSLYVPRKKEDLVLGLGDSQMEAHYSSIGGLLLYPFRQFVRKAGVVSFR